MHLYTFIQRIEMVQIHKKKNGAETVKSNRTAFGHHLAPSRTF